MNKGRKLTEINNMLDVMISSRKSRKRANTFEGQWNGHFADDFEFTLRLLTSQILICYLLSYFYFSYLLNRFSRQ